LTLRSVNLTGPLGNENKEAVIRKTVLDGALTFEETAKFLVLSAARSAAKFAYNRARVGNQGAKRFEKMVQADVHVDSWTGGHGGLPIPLTIETNYQGTLELLGCDNVVLGGSADFDFVVKREASPSMDTTVPFGYAAIDRLIVEFKDRSCEFGDVGKERGPEFAKSLRKLCEIHKLGLHVGFLVSSPADVVETDPLHTEPEYRPFVRCVASFSNGPEVAATLYVPGRPSLPNMPPRLLECVPAKVASDADVIGIISEAMELAARRCAPLAALAFTEINCGSSIAHSGGARELHREHVRRPLIVDKVKKQYYRSNEKGYDFRPLWSKHPSVAMEHAIQSAMMQSLLGNHEHCFAPECDCNVCGVEKTEDLHLVRVESNVCMMLAAIEIKDLVCRSNTKGDSDDNLVKDVRHVQEMWKKEHSNRFLLTSHICHPNDIESSLLPDRIREVASHCYSSEYEKVSSFVSCQLAYLGQQMSILSSAESELESWIPSTTSGKLVNSPPKLVLSLWKPKS